MINEYCVCVLVFVTGQQMINTYNSNFEREMFMIQVLAKIKFKNSILNAFPKYKINQLL